MGGDDDCSVRVDGVLVLSVFGTGFKDDSSEDTGPVENGSKVSARNSSVFAFVFRLIPATFSKCSDLY